MGAPECIVFVRLAEDDEGLAHLDRLPDAEWCSVEDRGRKAGKKDAPRFFRQFRQTKSRPIPNSLSSSITYHCKTSTPCSSAICSIPTARPSFHDPSISFTILVY